MEKKRSSFTGRVGFVLAAAGSAVGLGNLWRFPYLAAKYGGGIFLLVYIILAITFGFALMVTEIAIGRKTGLSCISAYKKLDKRFGFMGWLSALVPVIITPYYCVIGGWVIRYFAEFVSGHGKDLATSSADFFSNFIGMKGGIVDNPMLWFIIFVALTSAVVIFGVEKGIEKVSKVMMPILVILCVVIAVFALTIDGALAGLKYYLLPDFSKFSSATVLGALGQLFYSMSLAMGIMITYGSYMKKEDNIEKSVRQIEIFDTGIALLAGLIIIPSVVAFNGGSADGINAGPGLMFITLPQVFNAMGSIGGVVGTLFFLLVFFCSNHFFHLPHGDGRFDGQRQVPLEPRSHDCRCYIGYCSHRLALRPRLRSACKLQDFRHADARFLRFHLELRAHAHRRFPDLHSYRSCCRHKGHRGRSRTFRQIYWREAAPRDDKVGSPDSSRCYPRRTGSFRLRHHHNLTDKTNGAPSEKIRRCAFLL